MTLMSGALILRAPVRRRTASPSVISTPQFRQGFHRNSANVSCSSALRAQTGGFAEGGMKIQSKPLLASLIATSLTLFCALRADGAQGDAVQNNAGQNDAAMCRRAPAPIVLAAEPPVTVPPPRLAAAPTPSPPAVAAVPDPSAPPPPAPPPPPPAPAMALLHRPRTAVRRQLARRAPLEARSSPKQRKSPRRC